MDQEQTPEKEPPVFALCEPKENQKPSNSRHKNLFLDLTKAKTIQETLAKKAIGGGQKDPKFAEMEAKNVRLTQLVQRLAEENKEAQRGMTSLRAALGELTSANLNLCQVAQTLKSQVESLTGTNQRLSRVTSFFRALLRPETKPACAHAFCQRFLAKIIEGLKREDAPETDPGETLPVFESLRRNYSLFYTI